mmetsp:Transcript_5474/g.4658  ORF Transcript_5474/g.4658 Transcript_5474/m.4658 type:complete len:179 (+) Transcript_5474:259-795(+)
MLIVILSKISALYGAYYVVNTYILPKSVKRRKIIESNLLMFLNNILSDNLFISILFLMTFLPMNFKIMVLLLINISSVNYIITIIAFQILNLPLISVFLQYTTFEGYLKDEIATDFKGDSLAENISIYYGVLALINTIIFGSIILIRCTQSKYYKYENKKLITDDDNIMAPNAYSDSE